ncbi:MAG: hypothetical protein J6113_07040 [Lachnospiraceae bacterium]|nr:hypothetical protein [Lachnospiraceae bacterium]
MSDMKKSFKLVKYSLNFRGALIAAIAFFLVGTVFEITGDGSSLNAITSLYYGMPGAVIVNMFLFTQVPGMVRASRLSYYASTKAASLATLVCSLAVFTVLVVLRLSIAIPVAQHRVDEMWELGRFKLLPERLYFDLIKSAFIISFLIVYTSVAFRRFWISICIMVAVIMGVAFLGMVRVGFVENFELSVINGLKSFAGNMFVPLLLAISYAILLLGIAVFRLINTALFKYEIEEISYKNALKSAYSAR